MVKNKICKFCQGAGKLDFKDETCYFCEGTGNIEAEILDSEKIRRKSNEIQSLLDGTNIDIPDNDLIDFLNRYRED